MALLRPTMILERREPNMNCVYDCKLRPHILSWLFLLGMNLELSTNLYVEGNFEQYLRRINSQKVKVLKLGHQVKILLSSKCG